ncbi:MAG: O-antigen ligase family protein, partial [Anaerolineae bacterium]
MTRTRRPGLAMYLLMEAGLIVSLAYLTLIGGGFAGVYFYAPRLLSQVILGIVGGGWLASKFVRKEPWPTTPIDRPLLAALGVVTLSTLFSSHPRLSLENAPLIFAYAFAFWLLYEKIQAPWFADLLLKCAFAVVGITCLVASTEFISWYLGLPDGPSWPSLGLGLWPTQVPRIGMESLGSPNHLSAYLAPLIPLVVARGAASSRRIERLGLWLLALLMLGLIGVSQSRGGLLGALGGLIALAVGGWTRLGKRWPRLRPTRWRVAAALSLLGAALTGLVAALAMWRISTARVRVHLWSAALKMTAHRPLLGIGPGSFGLEYLRYRDAARFTKVFSQAHNIYLHTLATLGIGGALASGWLLWSLVSAALRLWRSESSRTQRWIRLGAMAGLSAFATHGLFDALSLKFPAAFHVVILLT